ncbi:MAG: hypothetical protein QNI91_14950 [Arenicellales bacterium]|nr:hypothetical protein [Arenicellales bacterium]
MQSGRHTLGSIDQGLLYVQKQIEQVDQEIKEASGTLAELQKEQANRFKRMAKVRLDNIVSGELAAGLDAVSQRVNELLEERVQSLRELTQQIETAREERTDLNTKRDALNEETVKATEALDKAEAATQRRLEQDADYQAQLQKTREAERTAEHAEDKTRQAEEVRKQKGKPYEEDPLFFYLWKRGYGMSTYSVSALMRYLDRWVARLCDYHEARPNYAMLLEIPKRLHEHAQRVRVVADQEFEALKGLEEKAAEQDDVPAYREALQKAQSNLDAMDAEIEKTENQLHDLEKNRTSFASGEDTQFKQAIDMLSSAFERENLFTLYDYARATATAEDDVLVRELDAGAKLAAQIKEVLAEHKRVRERHLDRLQELEDVRRRFKRQHFDSAHSGFGNAALVALILNQFLQGTATSDELWRTIEREQRYRRIESNPDFGSGGFGRRQGTWHFPFPRGGGMGGLGRGGGWGGGRKGGFGGGGGFKTGGGF